MGDVAPTTASRFCRKRRLHSREKRQRDEGPEHIETIVDRTATRTITAPIEVVASILSDSGRKSEWQSSCIESRTVHASGEETTPLDGIPSSFLEYQVYELPYPLSKRDYVFSGEWTFEFNESSKKAQLHIKSAMHDDAPKASEDIV